MMFEPFKESSLSIPRNRLYFGFAFDGTKYYLTSSDKQILILDNTYIQIGSYSANRFYYSLCFDPVSDCFWALAIGCPGMLFRLSHEFQEIGRVGLITCNENFDCVGGLSYDCCNNRLLFIGGKKIYATDHKGNLTMLADLRGREDMILSVGAVPGGLLYLAVRQNRSYLISISLPDGKLLEKAAFPDDCQARNLLVQSSRSHPEIFALRIFAMRQGYLPCLFECQMEQHPVCRESSSRAPENKCSCTTSCKPLVPALNQTAAPCAANSSGTEANLINFLFGGLLSEVMHSQTSPSKLQLPGCLDLSHPSNRPPCPAPCCPCPPKPPCSCHPEPPCPCHPEPPCPCHPEPPCSCHPEPPCSCHPEPPCPCHPEPPCPCHPECPAFDCGCQNSCRPYPPCDCNCGCGCNRCDRHSNCCCHAYADALESIALAEASIAHILNAEGEKLQKVIASNCAFHELLKVNESVQGTIANATYLEQVLTTKLETLLRNPVCCSCKKPKPCCPPREEESFACGSDPFSGIEAILSLFQQSDTREE